MAAVICTLLVAVAVGLAQLDQFEQIQQEGHLKHVEGDDDKKDWSTNNDNGADGEYAAVGLAQLDQFEQIQQEGRLS